jgi:hypothetical protein
MKPGATGLVRVYKTAAESIRLRADFEIQMCPWCLLTEQFEVGRKELK